MHVTTGGFRDVCMSGFQQDPCANCVVGIGLGSLQLLQFRITPLSQTVQRHDVRFLRGLYCSFTNLTLLEFAACHGSKGFLHTLQGAADQSIS